MNQSIQYLVSALFIMFGEFSVIGLGFAPMIICITSNTYQKAFLKSLILNIASVTCLFLSNLLYYYTNFNTLLYIIAFGMLFGLTFNSFGPIMMQSSLGSDSSAFLDTITGKQYCVLSALLCIVSVAIFRFVSEHNISLYFLLLTNIMYCIYAAYNMYILQCIEIISNCMMFKH